MGNCCSGTSNEGEVKINKGPSKQMKEFLSDDTAQGGMNPAQKEEAVVKIQSMARGRIARKEVAQKRQAMGLGSGGPPNYSNPKVQEIKERLGGFNYEPSPKPDGVRRK